MTHQYQPTAHYPKIPRRNRGGRLQRIHLSYATTERLLLSAAQTLEAGLTIQQFVEGPALNAFRADVRDALRHGLAAGVPLSKILHDHGILDDAASALLAAAEERGEVPGTLRGLARRYETARQARRRLILGLAYPTFLLVSASVLMPLPMIVTDSFGAYLSAASPPILAVGAVLIFVFVVAPRLDPKITNPMKRVFLHVPVVKQIAHARATATFAEVLGASVSAGLAMPFSVQLAATSTGHPLITTNTRRMIRAISDGHSLADAMRKIDFFRESDLAMIGHGEHVGKLHEVLPRIAEERLQRAKSLTMMLIIGLSAVAFALVVAMVVVGIIDGATAIFDNIDRATGGMGQ